MRLLLFTLLAIFAGSICAEDAIPELEISNIKKGVFLHKSHHRTESYGVVSSNGLIVVEDDKAFLIDTPWSVEDTKKVASWIKDQGYELVGNISTHSHDDKTAGVEWLNSQSVITYAHRLTNEILKDEGKALASNSFDTNLFELFDGNVEAYYPGAGHVIDNLVIWLPEHKILYGGCFVRSLGSKGLGYTGEAYIDEWAASAENVLSKYSNAEVVIPGHGNAGDIRMLEHTRNLAEKIASQPN